MIGASLTQPFVHYAAASETPRLVEATMQAITMQVCAPIGSASTWTREDSARIASEWLLMGSQLKDAVLIVGTTGAQLEIEPELLAFFVAEGGAAVVVAAPVRNPDRLAAAAAGVRVLRSCPARIDARRPVAGLVRYQVPLVVGNEIVVPGQRVTAAELERAFRFDWRSSGSTERL